MTVLLMDRFESSPQSERATVARPDGHRTNSLSGNDKKIPRRADLLRLLFLFRIRIRVLNSYVCR